jgi:anthranilate/para-aminobenzoate synthase component II
LINHNGERLFSDIPNPLLAGRYHSLVISRESFNNKELKITSETDNQIIMSIEHKDYPVFGLQFHPESLLTNSGKKILENFLKEE